jgi:hypothetical protein
MNTCFLQPCQTAPAILHFPRMIRDFRPALKGILNNSGKTTCRRDIENNGRKQLYSRWYCDFLRGNFIKMRRRHDILRRRVDILRRNGSKGRRNAGKHRWEREKLRRKLEKVRRNYDILRGPGRIPVGTLNIPVGTGEIPVDT